ncbi:hypothetical protein INT45_005379 [Circinella minor]|uniref:Arrestin-like N-terminal domain-containing protein n=1 Tax=Circinella minor TaxID=1195481 RepID=A0A8H7RU39_9FUNG|nr:hypothetical protein INT45_005379 [Circinella minor]
MASLLSSAAAQVTTRHRASSSASSLAAPPTPQHTNHPSHPPPVPTNTNSSNRTRSGSQSSTSQTPFSTSAPSFSNLFHSGDRNSRHLSVDSEQSNENNSSNTTLPQVTSLSIEFEGGTHVIVRPNRVVRGKVILNAAERMHVTRIRIKFRAEESAMVKVEEGGGDSRGEWIHQEITTFFETDWKLWGNDTSNYSQSGWDDLEAGHYEFPFALKFPNVNYPPSMEEPSGFAIRYIWTAQADGPALQSGTKSREYITPYRPIIISTPDEPFEMQLNLTSLHADAKILSIDYKFRKHHEVIHGSVPISSTSSNSSLISETVRFDVPTRLVSPSFTTRHTRVHYGLQFIITIEQGHLFKNNHIVDFSIPLIIANLPHDHLLRIPDLTAIQNYRDSKECPLFFDSGLDEPPEPQGLPSDLLGPLTAALIPSPPQNEEPPSYFSLPNLPPQLELRKERKERTVYLTRPAKGAYHAGEIMEAAIIPGLFDEDW